MQKKRDNKIFSIAAFFAELAAVSAYCVYFLAFSTYAGHMSASVWLFYLIGAALPLVLVRISTFKLAIKGCLNKITGVFVLTVNIIFGIIVLLIFSVVLLTDSVADGYLAVWLINVAVAAFTVASAVRIYSVSKKAQGAESAIPPVRLWRMAASGLLAVAAFAGIWHMVGGVDRNGYRISDGEAASAYMDTLAYVQKAKARTGEGYSAQISTRAGKTEYMYYRTLDGLELLGYTEDNSGEYFIIKGDSVYSLKKIDGKVTKSLVNTGQNADRREEIAQTVFAALGNLPEQAGSGYKVRITNTAPIFASEADTVIHLDTGGEEYFNAYLGSDGNRAAMLRDWELSVSDQNPEGALLFASARGAEVTDKNVYHNEWTDFIKELMVEGE